MGCRKLWFFSVACDFKDFHKNFSIENESIVAENNSFVEEVIFLCYGEKYSDDDIEFKDGFERKKLKKITGVIQFQTGKYEHSCYEWLDEFTHGCPMLKILMPYPRSEITHQVNIIHQKYANSQKYKFCYGRRRSGGMKLINSTSLAGHEIIYNMLNGDSITYMLHLIPEELHHKIDFPELRSKVEFYKSMNRHINASNCNQQQLYDQGTLSDFYPLNVKIE